MITMNQSNQLNQFDQTSQFDDIDRISTDIQPIIQCRNLTKTYNHKTALSALNIALKPGRIIGLLGPNGSGKTTLLKLINGLLTPTSGTILVGGHTPGVATKAFVSYLPERTYLAPDMRVREVVSFFADFYADFDSARADAMLSDLNIDPNSRLKTLSKGTREKVQLILVMSRRARLYCLDEPIAGVDPAARDYILRTIITNYDPDATILISTHLIADIEKILDEVIFIQNGSIIKNNAVEDIRESTGQSIDSLFREVFKC